MSTNTTLRYGVYMTADIYLHSLLAKYAVRTDANSHLRALASHTIYPVLQKWAGEFLRGVTFSGSFAKGTANSCSNDLDLFISLASHTPGTLGEIYNNLELELELPR